MLFTVWFVTFQLNVMRHYYRPYRYVVWNENKQKVDVMKLNKICLDFRAFMTSWLLFGCVVRNSMECLPSQPF